MADQWTLPRPAVSLAEARDVAERLSFMSEEIDAQNAVMSRLRERGLRVEYPSLRRTAS